jgi:hypothetical protein
MFDKLLKLGANPQKIYENNHFNNTLINTFNLLINYGYVWDTNGFLSKKGFILMIFDKKTIEYFSYFKRLTGGDQIIKKNISSYSTSNIDNLQIASSTNVYLNRANPEFKGMELYPQGLTVQNID